MKTENALEKLNHTICLNLNKNNIEFNIDKDEHIDCVSLEEFGRCYDELRKAIKRLRKYEKCIDLKEANYISTHKMTVIDTDTFNDLIKLSKIVKEYGRFEGDDYIIHIGVMGFNGKNWDTDETSLSNLNFLKEHLK